MTALQPLLAHAHGTTCALLALQSALKVRCEPDVAHCLQAQQLADKSRQADERCWDFELRCPEGIPLAAGLAHEVVPPGEVAGSSETVVAAARTTDPEEGAMPTPGLAGQRH